MGKRLDKEYEVRIAGMINAYNIGKTAENEGKDPLEAIQAEIKRRGIIKADIGIPDNLYHEWWNTLSNNLYQNMQATVMYVLSEKFGFGKTRLDRFLSEYDNAVQNTMDLDYMGEHYVTLTDYAVYLNEKYKLGLDIDRIAVCQDEYDEGSKAYHNYTTFKGIINLLKINGYDKSAEFLENHLEREKAKWQEQGADVKVVGESQNLPVK